MAAGSSLPEVFSSFVALANPDTDNTLGMDTIVGSSVYNTLVIVGCSAIASACTENDLLCTKAVLRGAVAEDSSMMPQAVT